MKKDRKIVCIIPYNQLNQVLLITSRKHPNQWLFPKGGVEKEETYIQAAEREGFEEAGIKGEVTRELGLFKGVKKDKEYEFWIYSFKVNELVNDNLWLEVDERKREWFTIEQALTLLKYEAMKEALVKFKIISK